MKFEILNIAGYGRSGSTLVDITIGNHSDYQSLGELTNFINHSILNKEYCSCVVPVDECKFWSNIYKDWVSIKTISDSEYLKLKHRYIRNKASLRLLLNFFFFQKILNCFVMKLNLFINLFQNMPLIKY